MDFFVTFTKKQTYVLEDEFVSPKANLVLEDYVVGVRLFPVIAFNSPISRDRQHMFYGLAIIFFDIWPLYVTVFDVIFFGIWPLIFACKQMSPHNFSRMYFWRSMKLRESL